MAVSDFCVYYAAQLNLTQYWGVWGGKYCYSAYDPPPPPGRNNTKAPCPIVKQPPLPNIQPVDLPKITQLSAGQIFVGGAEPEPIQIKVSSSLTSDTCLFEVGICHTCTVLLQALRLDFSKAFGTMTGAN